jgi:hypothetical protein
MSQFGAAGRAGQGRWRVGGGSGEMKLGLMAGFRGGRGGGRQQLLMAT